MTFPAISAVPHEPEIVAPFDASLYERQLALRALAMDGTDAVASLMTIRDL